jgi:hypothetical protein
MEVSRCSGETCSLHLQGQRISQARNQPESSMLSKTLVGFQWTTWHYIPEDGIVHNYCFDNLKSYISFVILKCSSLFTLYLVIPCLSYKHWIVMLVFCVCVCVCVVHACACQGGQYEITLSVTEKGSVCMNTWRESGDAESFISWKQGCVGGHPPVCMLIFTAHKLREL